MNGDDRSLANAVLPVVRRYVRHFLGRSPSGLTVTQSGNMLIARMSDLLTEAEMRMLQNDPSPAGRELIELMFRKLVRQSQESLCGAVSTAAGIAVRSVMCDIDCGWGEGVLVLFLAS
jgi:uncharacterized protein YbcI